MEHRQRVALEQMREDADLMRRKIEVEFNGEKRKMQQTLEVTIAQLNNSQRDVIDRTLVANLVVSYFKKRR